MSVRPRQAPLHPARRLFLAVALTPALPAAASLPAEEPDPLFEEVLLTAAQQFYDPEMAGLDWPGLTELAADRVGWHLGLAGLGGAG